MSRAYSSDLRQRIVDAITRGETRRAAAAIFKVSPATAVRLKQRADRSNGLGRAVPGGVVPAGRQIEPLPGCHYRQGGGTTGYHHARPDHVAGRLCEGWSLEPVKGAMAAGSP